jgi:hypothetical protein
VGSICPFPPYSSDLHTDSHDRPFLAKPERLSSLSDAVVEALVNAGATTGIINAAQTAACEEYKAYAPSQDSAAVSADTKNGPRGLVGDPTYDLLKAAAGRLGCRGTL